MDSTGAIAWRRRRHQHRDQLRSNRVVGVSYVEEGDEVLLITQQGMM
jgi:hypothetical protein